MHHLINGRFVDTATASLPITDLAILRGYGIFDYFRVKNFVPLFVRDHAERFALSAERNGLKLPVSPAQIVRDVERLVEKNGTPDAGIRLLLTGGVSPDGFSPGESNYCVLQHDYPHYAPHLYTQGCTVLLDEFMRQTPTVKTIDYAHGIRLLPKMRAAGASDVLYHCNGEILETTRANFCIVFPDGTIQTRTNEVLPGITKKHTLHLAREAGYPVLEETILLDDLARASEAFVTGSGKQIMPVVRVGDQTIGNGTVGPVVHDLITRFEALVARIVAEGSGKRTPARENVLDWL